MAFMTGTMTAVAADPRTVLGRQYAETIDRIRAFERDHAEIAAASAGSNADDEHDPEGSTIAFERAQVAALAEQARSQLAELEAALVRLERGDFGVCERCGRRIPAERLEARPMARSCVTCV